MREILVFKNERMQGVYSIGAINWTEQKILPLNEEEKCVVSAVVTDNLRFYLPECESKLYLKGAMLKQDGPCIHDIKRGIGIIPYENFDSKTLAMLLSYIGAQKSESGRSYALSLDKKTR